VFAGLVTHTVVGCPIVSPCAISGGYAVTVLGGLVKQFANASVLVAVQSPPASPLLPPYPYPIFSELEDALDWVPNSSNDQLPTVSYLVLGREESTDLFIARAVMPDGSVLVVRINSDRNLTI
jgi:hypothetical protein